MHPSGAHGAAGGYQREGRGGKGRDGQQLGHTRRCAEEIQILKEQGQQDRGHAESVICLDVQNSPNRIPQHNGWDKREGPNMEKQLLKREKEQMVNCHCGGKPPGNTP